ncbi:hypothetical protein CEQ90_19150 [Lewinellaceae bacterium SD302]|nr:hypothetical protein CEQ90_19150 [Lewinellaceae bacterium SD302]
MPAIFDLSTGNQVGAASDDGVLSANAGYQLDLSLSACHGFTFKLGGEAAAKAGITAEIAEYIDLLIQAEAGVKVQAEATAVLSPELDKDFGLTLAARAVLQAYVKFAVQMGLKAGKLTAQATDAYVNGDLPSLPYRLFTALLEDVSLGAAVEGKAEVALAAQGVVSCRGNLLGKDPGFDVSVSGEAAFIFGMGVDFAVKGRFPDQKKYFLRATEILIDECIEAVREKGDNAFHQDLLEIGLRAAFMIMLLPLPELNQTERNKLTGDLGDSLQSFLFRELLKTSLEELNRQFPTNPPPGLSGDNAAKFREAKELIESAVEADNDAGFFTAIAEGVDVLETFGNTDHDKLREIIASFWMLEFLRHDADQDNPSPLRSIPGWLQSYYQVKTGERAGTVLTAVKAAFFLERTDLIQQLITGNQLLTSLNDYAKGRSTTLSAVLLEIVQANRTRRQELIDQHLFGLIAALFDLHLLPIARTELKTAMSRHPVLVEYFTEVIEPALVEFPHYLPLVQAHLAKANKKSLATLKYLGQRFYMRLLGRSTGLLVRYLLNSVVEHNDKALRDFRSRVGQPDVKRVVYNYVDKIDRQLESMFGPLGNWLTDDAKHDVARVTQKMLVDTSVAARKAVGRPTWTKSRILSLTDHLGDLLAEPDGKSIVVINKTIGEIEQQIKAVRDCSFLPHTGHVRGVAKETLSLALAQFKVMLIDMPAIILRYGLELARILLLEPLIRLLRAAYDALKNLAKAARDRVVSLLEDIQELVDEIDDLLSDAARYAARVADDFAGYIDDLCDQLLDWIETGFLRAVADGFLDAVTFGHYDTAEEKAEALIAQKRSAMKNAARSYLTTSLHSPDALVASSTWFLDVDMSDHLAGHLSDLRSAVNFKDGKTVDLAYGNKVSTPLLTNSDAEILTDLNTEVVLNESELFGLEDLLVRRREQSAQLDWEIAAFQPNTIPPGVEIISPHKVELEPAVGEAKFQREKLPIYGKYLYVQIKCENIDLQKVITDQADDEPGNISLERPYRLKIILNGKEIDLTSFRIHNEHYLEGFVDKKLLLQGQNHIFAVLAGISERQSSMDYTVFFCDLKRAPHFSNDLHIDKRASQIDAPGNDHGASTLREKDLEDREYLVIATRSQQAYDLKGYRIEDTAGHTYEFKATKLKPDEPVILVTGPFEGQRANVQSWLPPKGAKNKAILNNRGEALLLRDSEGRVVDQAYFGNPRRLGKKLSVVS